MTPPSIRPVVPSARPALDLIALAKQSPEQACENLRSLLLSDPNYFGNLTSSSLKTVLNIQENTTYESIGAVGYHPHFKQVHAKVQIKRNYGYSGSLRNSGSREYVRFYLSSDDAATWEDLGLRGFEMFDVPGPKPLEHTVSVQLNPREEWRFALTSIRVRAILSWNTPPPADDAKWTPIWGDVAESQIRVEGSRFVPTGTIHNGRERGLTQSTEHAPPRRRSLFFTERDSDLYERTLEVFDRMEIDIGRLGNTATAEVVRRNLHSSPGTRRSSWQVAGSV
jgi:hypothetical protein